MFIMCQCLFITSLTFGKEKLHIMEKRTMPAQIGLEIYKSDLLNILFLFSELDYKEGFFKRV